MSFSVWSPLVWYQKLQEKKLRCVLFEGIAQGHYQTLKDVQLLCKKINMPIDTLYVWQNKILNRSCRQVSLLSIALLSAQWTTARLLLDQGAHVTCFSDPSDSKKILHWSTALDWGLMHACESEMVSKASLKEALDVLEQGLMQDDFFRMVWGIQKKKLSIDVPYHLSLTRTALTQKFDLLMSLSGHDQMGLTEQAFECAKARKEYDNLNKLVSESSPSVSSPRVRKTRL